MTAQSQKTKQKWLYNCVLVQPEWLKNREKARQHDREALTIGDFVANTIARVENQLENAQARRKTTLLGKYRFKSTGAPLGECRYKGLRHEA
ncbi:MAG: hypothetical protein MK098_15530 [Marinovum sp.]|nr:hypothetical protein [Marinovum sp.]